MNRSHALLCGALLVAQPALAENLIDIVRAAQSYDAQFAAARQSEAAARERPIQGLAGLLPTLNATGNSTWNDSHNGTSNQSFTYNSNAYAFTLSQPLFRVQNYVVYRQGELTAMQADMTLRQSANDLVIRASQAYFDVLAARDSLAFIQAQKIAIAEQLAQAKRNFEVGTATITDTNEAQARYDLATAQEIAADNDLEIRRRALAQIAGQRYETLVPLKPSAQIPGADPNDMNVWVSSAQKDSYAVRAQEYALEIANREIERSKYAHYPTLDVVATHGRNVAATASANGIRTQIEASTIGLQLAIPLFAGGATQSRVRESVSLYEKARSDLDHTRRSTEFSTRQAFLGLANGLAQVRALGQALRSSETALASNRLGYNVGVRINIDVLNSQQQVFQTMRDLSKARYDAIINGLKLKTSTVGLMEEDLNAINGLLGSD
ncbi:MAG: channel protein TolC [Betaproteobacteria bacterium]|nr:channel protein TolC [Betaproteobacteria bacterium]